MGTITNTYKPQPKWTGKLNRADAMADGESCTWYSQYYGYWCRASNQYWDGGYASGEYKSASVLTREWTSQQGLSKASGYTPVNTKEIKCLDANPATTSWNP